MPRVKYLDTVRGVEIPRIVARSDNTYAPQRRIYNRRNAQYDLSSWNAESPKQRSKINHQKDEYNKREYRNRQVTTKGKEATKAVKAKRKIQDAQDKQYQAAMEDLSTDTPYWLLHQTPDQLWDKDAVDRAKNQREWLGNSFWTTGSGWQARANNLDPYTQRELINEDFQRASFLPRLVAETATTLVPLGAAPGKFVKGAAAGYLGGKVNDAAIKAFTPYSSWNDMANKRWGWNETEGMLTNPGGWLGGFGYGRLSKAWNNPNSLLSRNIRTAFANDKVPYGYSLRDTQNFMPYIKGINATLRGKKIPYNERAYEKYGNDMFFNKEADITRHRQWSRYLGVGDDEVNSQIYVGGKPSKYVKNPDGTYDIPLSDDYNEMFLPNSFPKVLGSTGVDKKGRYVTYDLATKGHGGMGGQLQYDKNGNVVSVVEDVWDLHPTEAIKGKIRDITKYLFPKMSYDKVNAITNRIGRFIPKIEASSLLPAGAKPFTLRHTIPISGKYIGADYSTPTVGRPAPTFEINTLEDAIKAANLGGFVRKK